MLQAAEAPGIQAQDAQMEESCAEVLASMQSIACAAEQSSAAQAAGKSAFASWQPASSLMGADPGAVAKLLQLATNAAASGAAESGPSLSALTEAYTIRGDSFSSVGHLRPTDSQPARSRATTTGTSQALSDTAADTPADKLPADLAVFAPIFVMLLPRCRTLASLPSASEAAKQPGAACASVLSNSLIQGSLQLEASFGALQSRVSAAVAEVLAHAEEIDPATATCDSAWLLAQPSPATIVINTIAALAAALLQAQGTLSATNGVLACWAADVREGCTTTLELVSVAASILTAARSDGRTAYYLQAELLVLEATERLIIAWRGGIQDRVSWMSAALVGGAAT